MNPIFVLLLAAALHLAACGKDAAGPANAAPGGNKPVEVGVVTLTEQPVTLTRELPGRTSAFRVAEIRARVNGIIQKRLFAEGADVKAGQPLFAIDPAPYQATLDSALAQLARAEAMGESASSLAERFTTLIESNAVSRQEYDDALITVKTAQADVAAARAAVKTARINLGYTTVTAPLAGRIGRAEVTEGAYVQQASATLLATIQQLDKVYVDLTWSAADVLRLRRAIEAGVLESTDGQTPVTIVFEDGREHPHAGTLQFADASVDEATGTIALRAIVPNPKGELLPGMFVRARIDEGTIRSAILVPQRGVTRDQGGRPTALVVGADGKVERRTLTTDRAIGDAWLVTDGLAAGDRVIVEGLQKVRPGAPVNPVPAQAPSTTASAAPAAASPTPTTSTTPTPAAAPASPPAAQPTGPAAAGATPASPSSTSAPATR